MTTEKINEKINEINNDVTNLYQGLADCFEALGELHGKVDGDDEEEPKYIDFAEMMDRLHWVFSTVEERTLLTDRQFEALVEYVRDWADKFEEFYLA